MVTTMQNVVQYKLLAKWGGRKFTNRISRMSSARLHYTKTFFNSEHSKLSSLVAHSFVVHDFQLTM